MPLVERQPLSVQGLLAPYRAAKQDAYQANDIFSFHLFPRHRCRYRRSRQRALQWFAERLIAIILLIKYLSPYYTCIPKKRVLSSNPGQSDCDLTSLDHRTPFPA